MTSVSVIVVLIYMYMTMFNGCTAREVSNPLQRWEIYDGTVPFALLEAFVPQPATLEAWNNTAKLQFDEQW